MKKQNKKLREIREKFPYYIVLLKRYKKLVANWRNEYFEFPYYIVLLKPYVGKVHSPNKSIEKLVFNIFERRNF